MTLLSAPAYAEPVVVDVTRPVVFSNAEVLAMAGAGIAFAAGAPGLALSPASPASRREEAQGPLIAGLVLLHHRRGTSLTDEVRLVNVGIAAGYGTVAGGLIGIGAYTRAGDVWVTVVEGHAPLAVSLLDGHLTLGGGPRLLAMQVARQGEHAEYLGSGIEGGFILANAPRDWNFAVTVRSGVTAGPLGEVQEGIGAARLAPGVVAGVGWHNLGIVQQSARALPVRVVADVAVDASVADAVGLTEHLGGEEVPRGGLVTVSPRAAAEVDVWPDRLRLRAGTYLEPLRTLEEAKAHATGGFELRLFKLNALQKRIQLDLAWQVGVDWAPGYFRGAFLGINVWQDGKVGGEPRLPAGE